MRTRKPTSKHSHFRVPHILSDTYRASPGAGFALIGGDEDIVRLQTKGTRAAEETVVRLAALTNREETVVADFIMFMVVIPLMDVRLGSELVRSSCVSGPGQTEPLFWSQAGNLFPHSSRLS